MVVAVVEVVVQDPRYQTQHQERSIEQSENRIHLTVTTPRNTRNQPKNPALLRYDSERRGRI